MRELHYGLEGAEKRSGLKRTSSGAVTGGIYLSGSDLFSRSVKMCHLAEARATVGPLHCPSRLGWASPLWSIPYLLLRPAPPIARIGTRPSLLVYFLVLASALHQRTWRLLGTYLNPPGDTSIGLGLTLLPSNIWARPFLSVAKPLTPRAAYMIVAGVPWKGRLRPFL